MKGLEVGSDRSRRELRGLACFTVSHAISGWSKGAGWARETVVPTWVIAGDSRGTAKDLPQQCRVLPSVLNEDILQGLCPVKLIEDDGSWGAGQKAGVGRSG